MTKIEWTNRTWNPVTGCNKVSQGCKLCYAEVMHRRLRGMFPKKYNKAFLDGVQCHEDELSRPRKWKKPCMVFVNSMSDLFHKDVPFRFIASVFVAMAIFDRHTYQVLTKRADRLLEFYQWVQTNDLRLKTNWPLKNVWIGVSCEDQKNADERIPFLLKVPAAVRFLSCEPLLGPINICQSVRIHQFETYGSFHTTFFGDKIQWVITGGESGHKARPVHPDWVRSLRDECKTASVPFFFKQWGEYLPNFQERPESDDDEFFIGDWSGDPMEYFPDMQRYDEDQRLYQAWAKKRTVTLDDKGMIAIRYGKCRTGNLLDGVQHLEFPTTQPTLQIK